MIHKIDAVKQDKEALIIELEREEEFLTNTLQKQLREVQNDKIRINGDMLELKRQLEAMKIEREKVARQVEAEEEFLTNTLSKRLEIVIAEKESLEIRLSQMAALKGI